MRALFGLVSLLVVLGIGLLIFRNFEAPVIKQGEKAQDEARQMSGHGDDGKAAIQSFETQGKMKGSNLEGLTVTSVTPGGAMEKYGLRTGDEIVEVGDMKVGDMSANDPETAKANVVQEGFQKMKPVVVMRNGKRVTLPERAGAGNGTTANPSTPQGVQDQLKNLGVQTR
jgi:S1-C subfamily serine protease